MGNRHQGLRSRVTCYRILLTTAAPTRPLVPGVARGRPASPEGRWPCTPPRVGASRGTPGAFRPEASGRGLPNLGEWGQERSPKPQQGRSPHPSYPKTPGAADTATQGLWISPPAARRPGRRAPPRPAPLRPGPRAAHLPAALGAHAPAPLLCSSSGQSSPRGPARPLGPLTPGAAALTFPVPPGPSRPAASSGPHPLRRVSGSSATLSARRSAPRACALPAAARKRRPRTASPFSQPRPLRACARQRHWPREARPVVPRLHPAG